MLGTKPLELYRRARAKAQHRRAVRRPPSPLAIEPVEPRILLSGVALTQAAALALEHNLANLATYLQGLETQGDLGHALPLVNLNDATTVGQVSNLSGLLTNELVNPLQAQLSNLPADSGTLASNLSQNFTNFAVGVLGTPGNEYAAVVFDASSGSTLSFQIDIVQLHSSSFAIDFGSTGQQYGLTAPSAAGTLTVAPSGMETDTIGFFTFQGYTPVLAFGVTLGADGTNFSVTGGSIQETIIAAGTFAAGSTVDLGVLPLTVSQATGFGYTVNIDDGFGAVDGATLATDASEIAQQNYSSVAGALTSNPGTNFPTGTELQLGLTSDNVIPGIATFTQADAIDVSYSNDDPVVDVSNLVSAVQTAVGNPSFDVASFNTFTDGQLGTELASLGNYFDDLTTASELAVNVPFLSTTTLGDVAGFATDFQTEVVTPMTSVVGQLGFTESQIGTGSVTGTAVDIADLPHTIQLEVKLGDDGTDVALVLPDTYATGDTVAAIDSGAHLQTAIQAAIDTSTLAGKLTVSVDGSNDVTLTDTRDASETITLSSPVGSSPFNGLQQFGSELSTLLGYDVGLAFNGQTDQLTFSINKEFTPAPGTAPSFGVNFDLGTLGNLSLSNATLNLSTDVLLTMTAGFSFAPLGSDLSPNDITASTELSALPVWVQAGTGAQLTADDIAGTTGLADLQIIARDGTTKTYELSPSETLGTLENAISADFGGKVTLALENIAGQNALVLSDTSTPSTASTPADFNIVTGVYYGQTSTSTQPEQIVTLPGTLPTGDFQFVLSLGKLAPLVVDVANPGSSAAGFATAINDALADITQTVTAAQLGLSDLSGPPTYTYAQLFQANPDTNTPGAVDLVSNFYGLIYDAKLAQLTTNNHSAPATAAQMQEATNETVGDPVSSWGFRVDPLVTMAAALNGSLVPNILGLVGTDINAGQSSVGTIQGLPLEHETLDDRFFVQDAAISESIDLSATSTDGTNPIVLDGTLGAYNFTANLTPSNFYLALDATLVLNNVAATDSSQATLTQLTNGIESQSIADMWTMSLVSGKAGEPYGKLDVTDVDLKIGTLDLQNVASPEIVVTLDNPTSLATIQAPTVSVAIQNFNNNLSTADVIASLQQSFNALDSGALSQPLPLVDVSLNTILGFAANFNTALGTAAADTSAALVNVQTDINNALGGTKNYVSFSLDGNNNVVLSIKYNPDAISEKLPLNIDPAAIAGLLGSDGASLAGLESAISGIIASTTSGMLDVTAGVTFTMTLAMNINGTAKPAATTDLLSNLNDKKGLGSDGTSAPDLQFTLGDGTSFGVDLDGLGANATVGDLVNAINGAATQAGISSARFSAAYDATTGQLSLQDKTTAADQSGTDLSLTNGTDTDDGTTSKVTAADALSQMTTAQFGDAYVFAVNIGSLKTEVDLAADPTRTDEASFVTALRGAIDAATVSSTDLTAAGVVLDGGNGSVQHAVSLGSIVQLSTDSDHLVLSAVDRVIGANTGNALSVGDMTPTLSFTVQSLNGATAAQDLGLGSNNVWTDTTVAGVRTLTGSLEEPASADGRFVLDVGNDSQGDPLTGITGTVAIKSDALSFAFGAATISAEVAGGSAQLGADTGTGAAGDAGFDVGDPATAPATFSVTLNDGFGGSTSGDGKLELYDIDKLGTGAGETLDDLQVSAIDAAAHVILPLTIEGQPVDPLELQISNIFADPAVTHDRAATATFPDFASFAVTDFLDDPQAMIDGLDTVFSNLETSLGQDLYNVSLPLVGNVFTQTSDFLTTLRNDVIDELQSLLATFEAAHPGQPATTQSIVTDALNYVLTDELHVNGTVSSYLDNPANPTELGFVWQFSDTLISGTANLTSDLGIPGLGLDVANGAANILVNLDVTLGFGFLKSGGFFIYDTGTQNALSNWVSNDGGTPVTVDFQTAHALDLSLAAWLDPSFTTTVTLGFLQVQATNGTDLSLAQNGVTYTGTALVGDLLVDLGPNDTSGRMLFSDMGHDPIFKLNLSADLDLDLDLDASIVAALPSIETTLLFAYHFDKDLAGGSHDASDVTTPLEFKDVTLDAGSFLTNFLEPILSKLETVIGPIQPILNFLDSPLPGISSLLGPTSIIDLAQEFGGSNSTIADTLEFIKILTDVTNLYDTLVASETPTGIDIALGTFAFGQASGVDGNHSTASTFDPFSGSLANVDVSAMASFFAANPTNDNPTGNSLLSQLDALKPQGSSKFGVTFPILDNPMAVVKMLMGQVDPVDLIDVSLPPFNASFGHTFTFPIEVVPGLEATLGFSIGATIKLSFGFDTTGIIDYISDHDPADILEGFYIVDNAPQLVLKASITAGGELDLLLAKGGVDGKLFGDIDFKLDDAVDGKVYLSQILYELENDPADMFDVTGKLSAEIYVWYWVGIDFLGKHTLASGKYDIVGPDTLFSFSFTPHNIQLAHLEGSTLVLNVGPDAKEQESGPGAAGGPQDYSLSLAAGSTLGSDNITITVAGVAPQTYDGVSEITADLGTPNNTLILSNSGGSIDAQIAITGGNGDNTVNLAGAAGIASITLGNGNNIVTDSAGQTTVKLGKGNNTVTAGNAGDTITVGNGKNTITGGSGADAITAGNGNNTIDGGAGNDTITAGGGNNTIYGGLGNDTISIAGGFGHNVIFGGSSAGATVSAIDIKQSTQASSDGNDTITGGNGGDIIFGGGGNDIIKGGDGDNVILGGDGEVTRDGIGEAIEVTSAGTGGGNDQITGGGGRDIIIGGGGGDTLTAGDGGDIILAGGGTVDGPGNTADVAAVRFTITGNDTAGGTNTIVGGAGADVLIGGIGEDTITGGGGNDIISGDNATVIRTAALDPALLLSATTTDESQGGADTITGGPGNVVILGGAGNDTIVGGTGTDIILGDFGTVTTANSGQTDTVTGSDTGLSSNGDDTITTTGSAVIMGGGGNDTITGQDPSADHNDVVFGDSGVTTVNLLPSGSFAPQSAQTVDNAVGGNDTINLGNGNDVIFGGAGSDQITAGNGADKVFGDDGSATFATSGQILTMQATDPTVGGGDTITLGAGNDDVIGGGGSNTIHTGGGNSVLIADQGTIGWNADGTQSSIASTADAANAGSSTTIVAGNGNNTILGGPGSDDITAGNGSNKVLGDDGSISFWPGGVPQEMQSLDFTVGGGDQVHLGDGSNDVIGGSGNNTITAGNGNNQVLADQGIILWNANGQEASIATVPDAANAGTNTVTLGGGNNIVFGGLGNDMLRAGDGSNVVVGDDGMLTYLNGVPAVVMTTDMLGGNDTIAVGTGKNYILSGGGTDLVTPNSSKDIEEAFGTIDLLNGGIGQADSPLINGSILSPTGTWFNLPSFYDTLLDDSALGATITTANGTLYVGNPTTLGGAAIGDFVVPLLFTAPTGETSSLSLLFSPPGSPGALALYTVTAIGQPSIDTVFWSDVFDAVDNAEGGGAPTPTLETAAFTYPTALLPPASAANDQIVAAEPAAPIADPAPRGPAAQAHGEAKRFVLDEVSGFWVADRIVTDAPLLLLNGDTAPELILGPDDAVIVPQTLQQAA